MVPPPSTPPPPMSLRSLRWKGIILGAVADIAGSMGFGLVVGTAFVVVLLSKGTPKDQVANVLTSNPTFAVVGLTIGLCFDTIGGFIAGAFARTARLQNAFATGFISLTSGYFLSQQSHMPAWYHIAATQRVIPAALLGGFLSRILPEKKVATPPPLTPVPIQIPDSNPTDHA